MDLEKLIRTSAKQKADKIEMDLPCFDEVWEKAQQQRNFTNEKKSKRRYFHLGDWLQVAVILFIFLVLPVTITTLRNSAAGQIEPAAKQETAASQGDIEEARKVANGFLTEFYTVEDYNSFSDQDQILYPNDLKMQSIKKYTTDKYFTENLVPSTDALYIISIAKWNKCSIEVDKISLVKYSEDIKKKIIVFTTDVALKCKFENGSEKPASIRGQIMMQRDKDTWKVEYYTSTSSEPREIFDKTLRK
jgi:hypothetical protein